MVRILGALLGSATVLWGSAAWADTTAEGLVVTSTGVGSTVPSQYPMYRNVGASLRVDGRSTVLDGFGHRPDDGWDMLGFSYVEAEGNFRFTARLHQIPSCAYLNVGLMVREGAVGQERKVSLHYNTNSDQWQVAYRHSPGDNSGVNCPGGYRRCLRTERLGRIMPPDNAPLRLERRGAQILASYRDGRGAWVEIATDEPMEMLPDRLLVGLMMSCGNKGTARGESWFDSIEFVGTASEIDGPDAGVAPDTGTVDAATVDSGFGGADLGSEGAGIGQDTGGGVPDAGLSEPDGGGLAVDVGRRFDAGQGAEPNPSEAPEGLDDTEGISGGCQHTSPPTAGLLGLLLFGLGIAQGRRSFRSRSRS